MRGIDLPGEGQAFQSVRAAGDLVAFSDVCDQG